MLIPVLALLLIVSVVVGGGLDASSQARYPIQSAGVYREPVDAGTFIVAMVFLAILGIVFVPLLILTIIFW